MAWGAKAEMVGTEHITLVLELVLPLPMARGLVELLAEQGVVAMLHWATEVPLAREVTEVPACSHLLPLLAEQGVVLAGKTVKEYNTPVAPVAMATTGVAEEVVVPADTLAGQVLLAETILVVEVVVLH